MKRIIYRENGIILLEILLALVLLSMVLTATYTFYFTGLNSYRKGSAKADLQQNARIASDKICKELKWAGSYNIKALGNEIEFYNLDDNKRYIFRLRNRELEFLIGSTVTKVAYNVDMIKFSTGDNGTVEYIIKVKENELEYNLSSSVKPRNVR